MHSIQMLTYENVANLAIQGLKASNPGNKNVSKQHATEARACHDQSITGLATHSTHFKGPRARVRGDDCACMTAGGVRDAIICPGD